MFWRTELTFTLEKSDYGKEINSFHSFFFRQNSNVVNFKLEFPYKILRKMYEMMLIKYNFKKFRQMDERTMKSRKIMSDWRYLTSYVCRWWFDFTKKNHLFLSFFNLWSFCTCFHGKGDWSFSTFLHQFDIKIGPSKKSSLFVVWLTLFSRKNWFWETILWFHEKMVNYLHFYFSLQQFEFTKKTKNEFTHQKIKQISMMHIDYQSL